MNLDKVTPGLKVESGLPLPGQNRASNFLVDAPLHCWLPDSAESYSLALTCSQFLDLFWLLPHPATSPVC